VNTNKKKIKQLIVKYLQPQLNYYQIDQSSINDETDLYRLGLIDSLSLIELIRYLEKELDIEINIAEAELTDLITVNGLRKVVLHGK